MKEPVASIPQLGSDDTVVAMMKAFNMPMTRDQYVELAYMGQPPETIEAEVEAEMPAQFTNK